MATLFALSVALGENVFKNLFYGAKLFSLLAENTSTLKRYIRKDLFPE
jgi:hypothetical protein